MTVIVSFSDVENFMQEALRTEFCMITTKTVRDMHSIDGHIDLKAKLFDYLTNQIYKAIRLPDNDTALSSLLAMSQFSKGAVAKEAKIRACGKFENMSAYMIVMASDSILKRIIREEIKDMCNKDFRPAFLSTLGLIN
jgi:hypothetical protein